MSRMNWGLREYVAAIIFKFNKERTLTISPRATSRALRATPNRADFPEKARSLCIALSIHPNSAADIDSVKVLAKIVY